MEDTFDTFIIVPMDELQTLDIYALMLLAQKNQIGIKEFWETPLHIMLTALGVFQPPEKKPVSRKTLIEKEREMNRKWQRT